MEAKLFDCHAAETSEPHDRSRALSYLTQEEGLAFQRLGRVHRIDIDSARLKLPRPPLFSVLIVIPAGHVLLLAIAQQPHFNVAGSLGAIWSQQFDHMIM